MSVMLVSGLGCNLLSSSAALANGVETTISAFPAPTAKGENFPSKADHDLFLLDAILPELPKEYVYVGEMFSVMLWRRHMAMSTRKVLRNSRERKVQEPVQKKGSELVTETQEGRHRSC